MTLDIRIAEPHEYDEVAALTRSAFDAGAYGPTQDAERLRQLADAAGRAADGDLIVAVADGRLVGTVSLLRPGTRYTRQARDDERELRLLATAPASRGQGVGATLVADALARARRAGAAAVVLDTGPRNVVSQRLYHRLGFERVVERETTVVGRGIGRLAVFRYDLTRAGVRVRLVAPHEYDAVSRLSVDAYTHDYELPDDYVASIADVAGRAREHEVWVAEDLADRLLLGTVATPRPGGHLSPLGRDGELDFRLLAVAPSARGRGVGELLTRHVIELARQRGAERVVMNSGPRMVAAHRLYHRLGFVRLHERETERVAGGVLLAFGYDLAPSGDPTAHRPPTALQQGASA
ncbi:GNAT family N-acetyltransferase [Cellulomonas edaphi]|uniref:GNAT family N-acetyltransferase n=1 Tax=Cellulomonas edaphi TaxID=3053468 RepID=A0ABT7S7Q4_9CELL|nr:GNAT family N-acetyltransferase [Cellulomons edaphi]MDM7831661.1 GNAT family N-acetyltransferase [Cellulomons edaphi]